MCKTHNRLDVDTRHTMTSNCSAVAKSILQLKTAIVGRKEPIMEVIIVILLLLAGWTQQSSKILN